MSKYEFLDPWWQALHTYSVQHEPDRRRSNAVDPSTLCVLGVYIPRYLRADDAHKSIGDQCQELRNALELAFLQCVIDPNAFVDMARDHVHPMEGERIRHAILWEDDDEVHCRVEICPRQMSSEEMRESNQWIQTALLTMLTPQRLQDRSQAFQDAHNKLTRGGSQPLQRLKIAVGVTVHDAMVPALTSLVRELCDSPGGDGYPFQEAVLDVQTDLDSDTLTQLHACLQDSGRCSHIHLRFGNVLIRTQKSTDRIAYGHQLSSLLLQPAMERVPTTPATASKSGACLQVVTPSDPFLLSQFCSALMYSQGVDSVTMHWAPVIRGSMSRLLPRQGPLVAVTLFSPWARHGIRHVHLRNFMLRGSECEDLRVLLQLRNPIASLLPQPAQPNGMSKQVLVARHTDLWLLPAGTCIQLAKTLWLDVVAKDACDVEHYDVLVPAYGVCCMRRGDSMAQRPHTDGQSLTKSTITSLTLGMAYRVMDLESDQRDDMCRFLALVGKPLQELSVVGVFHFAKSLNLVRMHCPSLQCLRLTRVSSWILTALVDAYETSTCRVTSLDLRRVFVPPKCTSVVQFLNALADPTRTISQTLRKLKFRLERDFTNTLKPSEMRAVGAMLKSNTTLASLVLSLDMTQNEDLAEVCWMHHGRWLPGPRAPLQTRASFAFLSVVARNPTTAKPNRLVMDRDVITRILEMAAHPLKRKVEVVEGLYC